LVVSISFHAHKLMQVYDHGRKKSIPTKASIPSSSSTNKSALKRQKLASAKNTGVFTEKADVNVVSPIANKAGDYFESPFFSTSLMKTRRSVRKKMEAVAKLYFDDEAVEDIDEETEEQESNGEDKDGSEV